MNKEKLIKTLESKKQKYPPNMYCDFHNDGLNVAIAVIEECEDEKITVDGLEKIGFEKYKGSGDTHGMIHLDLDWNDEESTCILSAICSKDGNCHFLQIHSCGKTVQLSINENMSLVDIYHLQRLIGYKQKIYKW